jgi:hypothetical protein
VWRHGDRTPAGTFPNDIYQEDHWYQGWGALTPVGIFKMILSLNFLSFYHLKIK